MFSSDAVECPAPTFDCLVTDKNKMNCDRDYDCRHVDGKCCMSDCSHTCVRLGMLLTDNQ